MMQLKENQKKSDQDKQSSSALNTEEILSLLSKTSQDFKKESEITENISYLFNKKTPKDLALSSQIDHEKNQKPEVNKEIEKKEEIKEKEEEKVIEEKKVTETEAKNMANALAKEYYNKGYDLGVKKVKEELEKGEKALAVNLKNLSDNIFTVTPDFVEKLNEQINSNLKKISVEMLGYEIDNKTNQFFNKISELVNSFADSVKNVKIFLNKDDFDSISKFLNEQKITLEQELTIDENLNRGDIKIKSGSIEVANILSKKTKFVQSANIDDDLEKLRNKIENNEITVNDKDKTDLKENESKSENKK
jgi:flagellar biosynthesis/type III secretory pathway protein FliH